MKKLSLFSVVNRPVLVSLFTVCMACFHFACQDQAQNGFDGTAQAPSQRSNPFNGQASSQFNGQASSQFNEQASTPTNEQFSSKAKTQVEVDVQAPTELQPELQKQVHRQWQIDQEALQALSNHQQDDEAQEFVPVSQSSLSPMEESHAVDLIASPPPAPERLLKRDRKRLNIDQLEASVMGVLDGVRWTERVGNTDRNLFESLADTLGKPDFVQDTTEDLAPTSLFHKFLDDLARSTCSARVTADLQATTGSLWGDLDPQMGYLSQRPLIETQIKALVLKFHQRVIHSERELAFWTWIFQSGEFVSENPYGGWLGLCVALIVHPDFYSY